MKNDLRGDPRAGAARAPEPTRALVRAREEMAAHRAVREGVARRSRVRGLLLLAGMVLAGSVVRAGWERVFVPGWWRHW